MSDIENLDTNDEQVAGRRTAIKSVLDRSDRHSLMEKAEEILADTNNWTDSEGWVHRQTFHMLFFPCIDGKWACRVREQDLLRTKNPNQDVPLHQKIDLGRRSISRLIERSVRLEHNEDKTMIRLMGNKKGPRRFEVALSSEPFGVAIYASLDGTFGTLQEAIIAILQEILTKAEQLLEAAKDCLRIIADQNLDYLDATGSIVSEDDFHSHDEVADVGAKDVWVSSPSSAK
jgi:hypothetical protein